MTDSIQTLEASPDGGERMKQARYDAGLTQDDLAQRLSVQRQTVAAWEAGKAIPRAPLAPVLAGIFGWRSFTSGYLGASSPMSAQD